MMIWMKFNQIDNIQFLFYECENISRNALSIAHLMLLLITFDSMKHAFRTIKSDKQVAHWSRKRKTQEQQQ